MRRKPNRITMRDAHRLILWLEANKVAIKDKKMSPGSVARWATQNLDMLLTDNNITGVMGPSDSVAINFEWPRTRIIRSDKISDARLALVVQMVDELRTAMGHEPEGELRTLWYKMREELGVELAPVQL